MSGSAEPLAGGPAGPRERSAASTGELRFEAGRRFEWSTRIGDVLGLGSGLTIFCLVALAALTWGAGWIELIALCTFALIVAMLVYRLIVDTVNVASSVVVSEDGIRARTVYGRRVELRWAEIGEIQWCSVR